MISFIYDLITYFVYIYKINSMFNDSNNKHFV